MNRTVKFTSIVITISIIITLFSGFTVSTDTTEATMIVRDEKILCTATIDQEFDDSSVIVIMDNITGGINKQHELSFFGDIGATI